MELARFEGMNCSRATPWVLRVTFLLLSAAGMLSACNIGDVSLPTAFPIPDIELENETEISPQSAVTPDESPRQGPAIDLPPTWTPPSDSGEETPVPAPDLPIVTDSSIKSYIVQAGDTLAEIANQFGVTMDALAQINNITDQDHIEVGQELVIPSR
jgi:LysM repeat protein